MEPTNVDRALAALEEKYKGDPDRVEVLRRTRQFKSSWLQLAEALSEVKREKHWERWGYDAFETYAKTELKLRGDTVEKLAGSYMFLHKRAPEVLQRDPLGDAPMPSYQAIDFLRRAEERVAEEDSTVPDATIVDIRKKVLEEGVPVATVARLYNDTLFPLPEAEKKEKDRAALKSHAAKLRELLETTSAVPKGLAKTVSTALDDLLAAVAADKPVKAVKAA
jgi:hypothetical protein